MTNRAPDAVNPGYASARSSLSSSALPLLFAPSVKTRGPRQYTAPLPPPALPAACSSSQQTLTRDQNSVAFSIFEGPGCPLFFSFLKKMTCPTRINPPHQVYGEGDEQETALLPTRKESGIFHLSSRSSSFFETVRFWRGFASLCAHIRRRISYPTTSLPTCLAPDLHRAPEGLRLNQAAGVATSPKTSLPLLSRGETLFILLIRKTPRPPFFWQPFDFLFFSPAKGFSVQSANAFFC